ncbi:MAG: SGNH/GDSL hydrolase family protein [bacterium]
MRRMRATFLRDFLLRAGAVAIALGAGLLVAEIAVRAWNPVEIHQVRGLNASFAQHDELLGWRLEPNASARFVREDFDVLVSNNSHGFRDREYAVEKPRTTRRIVILGDSMTWGLGVENDSCYSEVLERALAAAPATSAGAPVEVLNFGAAGYGTDQEYLLLRDTAIRFAPDVVVIAYNANDVLNNSASAQHGYHKPFFKPAGGAIALAGVPVPPRDGWDTPWKMTPVGRFLMKRSALYAFVRVRLDFLFIRFGEESLFAKAGGYKLELSGRDAEITTRALFDSLYATSRANGAEPLLLITVPPRFMKKTDPFQASLLAHARSRSVRVLDLAPSFEAALDEGPLFWPNEGHWTPLGHRVAGGELARFIDEQQLLASAPAHAHSPGDSVAPTGAE